MNTAEVRKIIRKLLSEQDNAVTIEEFTDALLNLYTLNLEDDQVVLPKFDKNLDHYIFQIDNVFIHARRREALPTAGPFELFILDSDDDIIGFIRGTKNNKNISFNLVFINPDSRGFGIGTSIYEHFLDDGYTIKSDDEITEGTYNLYLKLAESGYTPLVFPDGRVGLRL